MSVDQLHYPPRSYADFSLLTQYPSKGEPREDPPASLIDRAYSEFRFCRLFNSLILWSGCSSQALPASLYIPVVDAQPLPGIGIRKSYLLLIYEKHLGQYNEA